VAEKEKVTLVVFSGELDKALASFNIAITAAGMGMDVTMFFTFWGLNIIKKNRGPLKSRGLMRKMLNWNG
jgi:peroxiredoxin family protein